jgi:8-oxo-dGTP pyrophosphatase MutT (NUDIX family)
MAFPGGRRDPADPNLFSTAVRETHEEVGLRLAPQDLIGRLDDVPALARGRPTGITIAPFVFALIEPPEPVVNAREVDEAVWTPLSPLDRGEHDTTLPYELDGQRLTLPAFDIEGRVVWGLTHRMIVALLERL